MFPQYPQNYPQYQPNYYMNAYQPQIQPQMQQPANLPQNNVNAPISPKFGVVQGKLAADMFQTDNGQEVILIDMDNPYVYHKKRGLDGKLEPMKVFRLVEETDAEQKVDMKEYVKQEEIESLVERIVREEVDKKLSEVTLKPKRKAEE